VFRLGVLGRTGLPRDVVGLFGRVEVEVNGGLLYALSEGSIKSFLQIILIEFSQGRLANLGELLALV